MLLKSLKYILSTIIFFLGIELALSDDLIIPKKKPIIQSSETPIKGSGNLIVPQQKPDKNKANKKEKKIIEKKITKVDGIIIPKNKPLIVKKARLKKAKKLLK